MGHAVEHVAGDHRIIEERAQSLEVENTDALLRYARQGGRRLGRLLNEGITLLYAAPNAPRAAPREEQQRES
jgi:hypothetical protein